ncbi:hypothetical protein ACFLZX_00205 [Nanoarchaeota archaeon]
MDKQIKVKYGPEFQNQLTKLKLSQNKFDLQLLKAIERENGILFTNPHRGIQIQKDKIPTIYINEYGITNLWKINLRNFWRMLYTITGNEIEIITILLEFMDHKNYNKLFKY